MASNSLLNQDQLLCPICLGVFVRPVSTPCGHNFCMSCLSSYWDSSTVSVCPVCKESYSQRPQLRVNTFISGLTQSFSSLQLREEPQTGVPCEVCTAPQQKAVKSCVECLSSFCSAHLEPHLRVPGLLRHTLVAPGVQSGADQNVSSDDTCASLRRVQRHAVDLRLDPKTAHPCLLLSPDQKQVWFRNDKDVVWPKKMNPKQFLNQLYVVTDRGFSSGKFYFEVFVGQKDEWLLGVIEESVPRVAVNDADSTGIWTLYFRVDSFLTDVPVHKDKVKRVGLFVDYDKGQVSFFDVQKATCIYTYTGCVFTERLYPLLCPCDHEFPSNLGPMKLVSIGDE